MTIQDGHNEPEINGGPGCWIPIIIMIAIPVVALLRWLLAPNS